MGPEEQAELNRWKRLQACHSRKPWQEWDRVPRKFWGKDLDNYDPDRGSVRGHQAALDWVQDLGAKIDSGRGLLFTGPPGTGKTHLAVGILARVAAIKAYAGQFITAWDFEELGFALLDYEPWENMPIAHVRERGLHWGYDVLVLDDLGNEYRKDAQGSYAKRRVERLVRERGNHCLTTIITTNYNDEQLTDFYGAPFVSYLYEACERVPVLSGDYRKAR